MPTSRLRSVLTVLIVTFSFGLGFPSPAHSAGATCGTLQHSFDGAYSSYSTATYGSRAKIELRTPGLCGSDTSDSGVSSAWSMVTAHSTVDSAASHDGWAQSGYIKLGSAAPYPTSGLLTFSQWTRKCKNYGTCASGSSPDNIAVTVFRPAPTGAEMYSNYLVASDDRIHMAAGSTVLDVMDYDVTGDWDPAWAGQFFAETFHPSDDVVGTSGNPASFYYLQRYGATGDINFYGSLDYNIVPGRYHRDVFSPGVGGIGFEAWTDPL